MSDLISRQAAIDRYCEHECGKGMTRDKCGATDCGTLFDDIPSAQPELPEFCDKCEVRWVHGCEPECKKRVLKQLERKKGKWIPCSEPPKESGTYIVTAYDGTDKRVTFVKYQKTLKRWDLTGARSYWHILAYKPLPEPWRGEEP